jgi:hypothetical protein
MADLGTSGGLQGIYQGDSAQNRPAYIKPKPNTFGDDIIAEMDKQEKRKKDEQDAFDKQLDPFISIDGSKYLPEKTPIVREQAQRVLQEAYKVRGKKGNVMLDENVNREIIKLQELQNKYGQEAATVRNFEKNVLNSDKANAYTDDAKEYTRKLLDGTSGIGKDEVITSKYYDDRQTYAAYRDGAKRAKHLQFKTPDANTDVSVTKMIGGNYVTVKVKGSEIYDTPEGQESQRAVFEEILKTSTNPYDLGYLTEAQENIDFMMKEDDVFAESFKDMTELEAQGYKVKEASKLMLRDAVNSNKKTTVDSTKRIPTGFNFTNNFQSTSGGGAVGKIWTIGDPIDQPLYEVTAEGKPIVEKPLVKNAKFFSLETVAGAENPKNIYLKGYSDAAIVGLTRNEDTGVAEYATIEIPEKKGRGGRIIPAEKKYVKIGAEDVSSIRNNIGAGQYDATVGNWKKPKEKAKKETPKAEPKKEAMYIVNGVAYPKSKLEKSGYDISKLKEYK